MTAKRSVVVHIDPLPLREGWFWSVQWENGGQTFAKSDDFPSAVTRVIGELREGQRHVSAGASADHA